MIAPRSASTTRSWSARSSRAWNGSAIVRALQSSLTGSIPSENPYRSRMYDCRWIDGSYGAVAIPCAAIRSITPPRSAPAGSFTT